MVTEEEKRNGTIEQGARAYRLGIELRHCPLAEQSARNLWAEGWEKAKKVFETMFPRREATMRNY